MTSRHTIERRLKAIEERVGTDDTFTDSAIVLVGIRPAGAGCSAPTEGRRCVLWTNPATAAQAEV